MISAKQFKEDCSACKEILNLPIPPPERLSVRLYRLSALPFKADPFLKDSAPLYKADPFLKGSALPFKTDPFLKGSVPLYKADLFLKGSALPFKADPFLKGSALLYKADPFLKGSALPRRQDPPFKVSALLRSVPSHKVVRLRSPEMMDLSASAILSRSSLQHPPSQHSSFSVCCFSM